MRARSIHELHVHPNIRNEKRIMEERKRGDSVDGQTGEEAEASAASRVLEGTTPEGVVPPKRIRLNEANGIPSEPAASPLIPPNNPNLPEGGLSELLRERARKMVSEEEGDGTAYTHVLEAWLEGSDQLPELVEAATQRILRDCRPGGEVAPGKGIEGQYRRAGMAESTDTKISPIVVHFGLANSCIVRTEPASQKQYWMEVRLGVVQYREKRFTARFGPNGKLRFPLAGSVNSAQS